MTSTDNLAIEKRLSTIVVKTAESPFPNHRHIALKVAMKKKHTHNEFNTDPLLLDKPLLLDQFILNPL
jgi:hypothetical protein